MVRFIFVNLFRYKTVLTIDQSEQGALPPLNFDAWLFV